MPDFLVVRNLTCSLVIEADTPEEALSVAQGISSGEFELHDAVDTIDPGYGHFAKLMREKP